jgi:hypothetical protein
MSKRITQASDWLMREIEKDKIEISEHKKKLIEEIKSVDKTKLFSPKPKKKISIIDKILIIFGYGKKD